MPWVGKEGLKQGAVLENWQQPPGNPRKLYKSEYAERAYQYCLLGAVDSELAEFFAVTPKTISVWKVEHKEFGEACEKGAKESIARRTDRVKTALYTRAVGYTYDDTKYFNYEGEVITQDCLVHVPPDVNAAKLWLVNHAKWSDGKTILAGDPDSPIHTSNTVTELTHEQAKELARARGLPDAIFDK